jgi:hypothetical protein
MTSVFSSRCCNLTSGISHMWKPSRFAQSPGPESFEQAARLCSPLWSPSSSCQFNRLLSYLRRRIVVVLSSSLASESFGVVERVVLFSRDP